MSKYKFPACPLPLGASVWTYLRDSGGETQDLASQRSYVLSYCDHYQLHLARLFEDGAISGGSLIGRDEFELMIEKARLSERPAVDGIIYWDTKRFARNQLDSQFFKADLRRRGYTLISISDEIPDNEFAIVFEAFLEWKAQKDREDISKDSKRGLAFIVGLKDEDGNFLSIMPGRPPTFFRGERYDTGLKRNNGKPRIVQRWVPDPETWEKGKLAWQMRSERASYKDIERELGIFPTTANPGSSYSAIFRNAIYIGRLNYGGRVYENFVPALATMEQWERVRALDHRRPARGKKYPTNVLHPETGRAHSFLLSGLCKCIYCRTSMWGNQNTRRGRTKFWRAYICARKKARPKECESKQVSAERLENTVVELVTSRILTIDFVRKLVDEVNYCLSDTRTLELKLELSQKHLRELDRAIQNLLDLAEINPSPGLLGRLRQREQEREVEQKKVKRLETQMEQQSLQVSNEMMIALLTDMRKKLELGEMKARQHILRQTVEKIEVGRDFARLHYQFPLKELNVGFWYMPPTGFEPVSQP